MASREFLRAEESRNHSSRHIPKTQKRKVVLFPRKFSPMEKLCYLLNHSVLPSLTAKSGFSRSNRENRRYCSKVECMQGTCPPDTLFMHCRIIILTISSPFGLTSKSWRLQAVQSPFSKVWANIPSPMKERWYTWRISILRPIRKVSYGLTGKEKKHRLRLHPTVTIIPEYRLTEQRLL